MSFVYNPIVHTVAFWPKSDVLWGTMSDWELPDSDDSSSSPVGAPFVARRVVRRPRPGMKRAAGAGRPAGIYGSGAARAHRDRVLLRMVYLFQNAGPVVVVLLHL